MMKLLLGMCLALASFSAQASSLPSFACRFTEPFISIDTYAGGALFITPENSTKAIVTNLGGGAAASLAISLPDKGKFELNIAKKQGSDGMSDFVFPFQGAFRRGSNTAQIGGCIQFPDGTSPRAVANISETDTLNVRRAGSTKSSIITKLRLGTSVWVFPEDVVKGWVRVAAPVYPVNGSGPIKVVEGWVNAKYLGKGVYAE
jgi:uncharacterized membrane protein